MPNLLTELSFVNRCSIPQKCQQSSNGSTSNPKKNDPKKNDPKKNDPKKNDPKKLYKGYFRANNNIHYSNGKAQCRYKNKKVFKCQTGNKSKSFPKKAKLLDKLENHGVCGVKKKCSK